MFNFNVERWGFEVCDNKHYCVIMFRDGHQGVFWTYGLNGRFARWAH